ncbi:MAG: hypothetical protein QM831_33495 [Kofleriaceae bacterium]
MRSSTWIVGIAVAACGDTHQSPPDSAIVIDAPIDAPVALTSAPIGPKTGFVAAVAFDPNAANTVWASGDDGDGLYRSRDNGATWELVTTAPIDWSSYALRFDPRANGRIWAPSYFGRGMVRSDDDGATWSKTGTGLPVGPGDAAKFFDLTGHDDILVAATGSGLYHSSDGGATFAKSTGGPTSSRAVLYAHNVFFAGGDDGKLYTSTDGISFNGSGGGGAITSIASGASGVYVATGPGLVVYVDLVASTVTAIVDPSSNPDRSSLLWTKLAVVPGATHATDRVIVGTTVDQAATVRDHLYGSDDGGATWAARGTGLDHASAFAIAIAPGDRDRIVLATIGAGLYVTTDAGATWTAGTGDLRATAALAFTADPNDTNHLVVGSSEALTGTPGVFETTNGGASWSLVTSLVPDALSFAFDPDDSQTVVVGTFASPGILRSTHGMAGPWTPIANVPSALRIKVAGARWYAVALDGTLYRSSDHGASWSSLSAGTVADLAVLQDHELACGSQLQIIDGDPVPMPTLDAGEVIATCASDNQGGLLLGTTHGRVWSASTTTNPVWTAHATPLIDADVRQVGVTANAWFACGMRADTNAAPTTVSGLFLSRDQGATWTSAYDTYPSTLCWGVTSVGDNALIENQWGGGVWRIAL